MDKRNIPSGIVLTLTLSCLPTNLKFSYFKVCTFEINFYFYTLQEFLCLKAAQKVNMFPVSNCKTTFLREEGHCLLFGQNKVK